MDGELSQNGSVLIFDGGLDQLRSVMGVLDSQIPEGDLVETQLRLRIHVPGLEDSVRLLLQPALGDNLIDVRAPGPILRVRWRKSLGLVGVLGIILGIAVILLVLLSIVIFVFPQAREPIVAAIRGITGAVAGPFLPLLLLLGVVFIFTQQGRR